MPLISFSQFAPDTAQLNADSSANILNAFPAANGYAPCPVLTPLSPPPEPVFSIWAFADTHGEVYILAGSQNRLYRLGNDGWQDVSREGKPYYAFSEYGWSFCAFGDVPLCCANGAAPQIWDKKLQRFRDLENKWQKPNPEDKIDILPVPYARRIAANNEFVFLLSSDEKKNRIYWSATRNAESWQTGQEVSASNDFDVGGEVMDISQGTSPLALLRRAIYKFNRAPVEGGFEIVKIATGIGCFYYGSSVVLNDVIYFLDESGFMAASENGDIKNIGVDRVNNFIRDWLTPRIPLCHISAYSDNRNQRIYWIFDNISLVYDVLRDRWTKLDRPGIAACTVPWEATNLDAIKSALNPDGTTMPLDSTIYNYEANIPCYLNANGELALQIGENDEALLDSSWQGETGQAMGLVNSFQPIVDTPDFDVQGRIIGDMTYAHQSFVSAWAGQSKIDGNIRLMFRGRTARIELRLPRSSKWRRAQGIDVHISGGGRR